jgi:DNA-binding XRE family transcriptional regulator
MLRLYRVTEGLSQADLAEEIGVETQTLRRLEETDNTGKGKVGAKKIRPVIEWIFDMKIEQVDRGTYSRIIEMLIGD